MSGALRTVIILGEMRMKEGDTTSTLIRRAGTGDSSALGELLQRHRDRMTRMVGFRMDRRLRTRIDPADVVQEAYVVAMSRFGVYLGTQPRMPFFLWLRFLTIQKLLELHRCHLGVKSRSVECEVSLYAGPLPAATSAIIAGQLLGKRTSPSQAAIRTETKLRLEEALNRLEPMDREVLALRSFEQLSNGETAQVLQISDTAASNRYVRALRRLKSILDRTASPGVGGIGSRE